MPAPLQSGMHMARVVSMHWGESAPQGIRVGGNEDQMDVVGHQHPSPDFNAGSLCMLGQKIAIEPIVVIAEKCPRPPVTALSDVVRCPRKHSASKASHEEP